MGAVTFSIPLDLAQALAGSGHLSSAVETGTYHGNSALSLSGFMAEVWTIEVDPSIYQLACARLAQRPNVHVHLGYSPEVLPQILGEVPGPALYWLDGHGGTFGKDDLDGRYSQCPVLDELEALEQHPHAARSCILIDDARAFFGPLPDHRPDDWPTFLEVADALRRGADRYVTVLDDVIIAVPSDLRGVVDAWWSEKLSERSGLEALAFRVEQLRNPSPLSAFKGAVRSVTPKPLLDRYRRWSRAGAGPQHD